ncbi:MAG: hypothetical protein IJ275_01770 [Ruminococcus sp.]|nr:hypothetical protein [Ruminococcus sp.]
MATTKKAATTAATEEKKTTAKKTTKAATTKKATAKAETKTATKAAAKVEAPKAEEKKAPAKKAAAKKTTAKVDLYIQFGGATVSVADIEKNVKKVVKGKKAYTVYVKPEESKAYIVADGETTGMDVFFCE